MNRIPKALENLCNKFKEVTKAQIPSLPQLPSPPLNPQPQQLLIMLQDFYGVFQLYEIYRILKFLLDFTSFLQHPIKSLQGVGFWKCYTGIKEWTKTWMWHEP